MQSHKTAGSALWSLAKERRGELGKEIRLVKNKQHKTAQKKERKERLNPAKEGDKRDKFLFKVKKIRLGP